MSIALSEPKSLFNDQPQLRLEDTIAIASDAFQAAELVFGHGTATARDEAAWLIAHAIGSSPLEPPHPDRILTRHQLAAVERLITRRIQERIPAAYLTGTTWFAGLPFKTDQRALIPRSPLAEWIMEDFYGMSHAHTGRRLRLLDLCTGGGCIALAAAVHYPDLEVVGSDISPDALALARENRAMHGLEHRVELIESDLFSNLDGRFDLIVSNPPYVDASDLKSMSSEYHHEPVLGLSAGEDGLDIVRRILREASSYLHDGGWLVVELGNSADAVEAAFPEFEFEWLEFTQGGEGVFALPARAFEPRP